MSGSARPPLDLRIVGNPKWKRTFKSEDIKPCVPLICEVSEEETKCCYQKDQSIASSRVPLCQTCNKNEGRYTCPRCEARYCSSSCYLVHDIPLQSCSLSSGNKGGGRCTESFFKERVAQEGSFHVKDDENKRVMRKILNRTHLHDKESMSPINNGDGDSNSIMHTNKQMIMSDDELMELAQHIFSIDAGVDNGDGPNTDLLDTIPNHLIEKFEQEVSAEDFSQFIKPWHPFWISEYTMDDRETCSNHDSRASSSTLDDRILDIVSFDKLVPNSKLRHSQDIDKLSNDKQTAITSQPKYLPELQYNVVDLLYSIAWTLRLYNGPLSPIELPSSSPTQNSSHESKNEETIEKFVSTKTMKVDVTPSFDMAESLLVSSAVLFHDARYTSCTEALTSCTQRRTFTTLPYTDNAHNNVSPMNREQSNRCPHLDWITLVGDVADISLQRRLVLRVLFCALDILESGYKSISGTKQKKMKRKDSSTTKYQSNYDTYKGASNKDVIEKSKAKKQFKIARKKIEYYISWCQKFWDDVGNGLVEDIKRFLEDWKLQDENVLETSNHFLNEDNIIRNGIAIHSKLSR